MTTARANGSVRRSPRVEARIADNRRRILDAARIVVSENGFAAARVAVVASVANVATGSVYRHFPSKASLFSEMLDAVCTRELDVVQAITTEPGRSAHDRLGDAVATFVERALRSGGLAYAVIVEPIDPEVDRVRLNARAALAAAFADLIDDGITLGEFAPQDVTVRGAAIVGAFLEGVVAPLADHDDAPSRRVAISAEIAAFCQGGVRHVTASTSATSRGTAGRTATAPAAATRTAKTRTAATRTAATRTAKKGPNR